MDDPKTIEVLSFFQNRVVKRLIFGKQGLTIEKPDSFDDSVFIAAENIAAFRFGVSWVRGYRFVIGRKYSIEIKDTNNSVVKIKLRSYYGIRRETYANSYADIVKALWDNYFHTIYIDQLQLYKSLQPFEFAGIEFLYDGISWDKKNKLLWHELAASYYKTYFTIHHSENPKQYKSFDFASDWNAVVLRELIRRVIDLIKKAE